MRVVIGDTTVEISYGEGADMRHFSVPRKYEAFLLEEYLTEIDLEENDGLGLMLWRQLQTELSSSAIFDGISSLNLSDGEKMSLFTDERWIRTAETPYDGWLSVAEGSLADALTGAFGDDFTRGQLSLASGRPWPFDRGSYQGTDSWVNLGVVTVDEGGLLISQWVLRVLCATQDGYPYLGYVELRNAPQL